MCFFVSFTSSFFFCSSILFICLIISFILYAFYFRSKWEKLLDRHTYKRRYLCSCCLIFRFLVSMWKKINEMKWTKLLEVVRNNRNLIIMKMQNYSNGTEISGMHQKSIILARNFKFIGSKGALKVENNLTYVHPKHSQILMKIIEFYTEMKTIQTNNLNRIVFVVS